MPIAHDSVASAAGLERGQPAADRRRDDRDDEDPRQMSRISMPRMRAIGMPPFTRTASGPALGTAGVAARCVRAPSSAAARDHRDATASATIDHPEDHRRLGPEREREELDEPVRRRVEQVGAGREEQLVEDLERRVEREDATIPPTTTPTTRPTRRHGPPTTTAPDGRAGGRRRTGPRARPRPRRRARERRRTRRGRRACGDALALGRGRARRRPRRRSRAGRTTRSARIASVAIRRLGLVKPVHAAASAPVLLERRPRRASGTGRSRSRR